MLPTNTPTPTSCPALSSYDTEVGACKCNTGYIVENNECVSDSQYCWAKYGGNATYDADKNSCSCPQGYTWNNEGTSCISLNQLCNNDLGSKSYYNNDDNACYCYQGYSIQNNECQLIPTQTLSNSQGTSETVVTNTPILNPTIAVLIIPSLTSTKSIGKKITPTLTVKRNVLGVKNYITVGKTQKNGFTQIINSIWNFILHLF